MPASIMVAANNRVAFFMKFPPPTKLRNLVWLPAAPSILRLSLPLHTWMHVLGSQQQDERRHKCAGPRSGLTIDSAVRAFPSRVDCCSSGQQHDLAEGARLHDFLVRPRC